MTRRYVLYFFLPLMLWIVEALALPWGRPIMVLTAPLLLFGFCAVVRERLMPAVVVILWTALLYQTQSASGSEYQIAVLALTALAVRKILQYFIPRPGFFAGGAAGLIAFSIFELTRFPGAFLFFIMLSINAIFLILAYGFFASQTRSYH